jgi:hypothetical protein
VSHIDPSTTGLTQLPTWFWVSGADEPVSIAVVIDGYTVTATAEPIAYLWGFGDGASTTSSDEGSKAGPSAVHTYGTKGSYTVGVSVEYQGTYTFSGLGVVAGSSLGTYFQPEVTTEYVVQEVRSVLTPGNGG